MMKITILGSGTSTGVPQIGCNCPTCTSSDPHDKRLRASVIVTLDNSKNILIDCGPDFRTQILRVGSPQLEALMITHSHYDHVGGIDDLRPYCNGKDFPVWCKADVASDLKNRNPWSFSEHPYPGVPTFEIHEIEAYKPFIIADTTITPLSVMHANLPILGFRIGQMAYITDCKTLPDKTIELLNGIDTLVINALRFNEHISHMTVAEALEVVKKICPKRTYFTHICHQMGRHADVSLPAGINLAYDGLVITE